MLKVRIIPTLLWKNLTLVKGKKFDSWRTIGALLPSVKVYNSRDVDELILLDIGATISGDEIDYDTIHEVSKNCFVPLTVGGGISNINQIRKLLKSGADKVSLNSVLFENVKLIEDAVKIFGSQCIVASIDVKLVNGKYFCFSHCGRKNTGIDPIILVKQLENRGVGEILLTSIDRDGTMRGYDIDIIKAITNKINIPLIASGGAGSFIDMKKAILDAGASAVAAASIFQFTEKTPLEAKHYLNSHNIPVRLIKSS